MSSLVRFSSLAALAAVTVGGVVAMVLSRGHAPPVAGWTVPKGPEGSLPICELRGLGEVRWLDPDAQTIRAPRGMRVIRDILIINRTGFPLSSLRSTSACACTSPSILASGSLAGDSLGPGATTVLRCSVDLQDVVSDTNVSVSIFCQNAEGPALYPINLYMRQASGEFRRKFVVNGGRPIRLDEPWSSHPIQDMYRFSYYKDIDLSKMKIVPSSQVVAASVVRQDPEKGEGLLSVEVERRRVGSIQEAIYFEFPGEMGSDRIQFRVPVTGWIVAPYSASPEYVHKGTVTPGAPVEAEVEVTKRDAELDDPVVKASGGWTLVGVARVDATHLRATAKPRTARPGDVEGKLTIDGREGEPTVAVPLYVTVSAELGQTGSGGGSSSTRLDHPVR